MRLTPGKLSGTAPGLPFQKPPAPWPSGAFSPFRLVKLTTRFQPAPTMKDERKLSYPPRFTTYPVRLRVPQNYHNHGPPRTLYYFTAVINLFPLLGRAAFVSAGQ